MSATAPAAGACASLGLGYLTLLLLIPLGMIFYKTFEDGIGAAARRDHLARRPPRAEADPADGRDRGAAEHDLRGRLRAAAGPPQVEGQRGDRRDHQPPLRDLPGRDRPLALPPLRHRAAGSARRSAEAGHRGPLLGAGDGPGQHLRLAAVRRPRDGAGPAGDRHRPGAGRLDPRRQRLADLLADHPAGDPLGRRLRRRPHHRAGAGRVRRGDDRLRLDLRPDPDPAALRRQAVRELQLSRRLRRLRWCSRCSR